MTAGPESVHPWTEYCCTCRSCPRSREEPPHWSAASRTSCRLSESTGRTSQAFWSVYSISCNGKKAPTMTNYEAIPQREKWWKRRQNWVVFWRGGLSLFLVCIIVSYITWHYGIVLCRMHTDCHWCVLFISLQIKMCKHNTSSLHPTHLSSLAIL